ncbi:hypothetical protein EJ05DRAFT_522542 [Pseudovirgaria hyperparasitica]|uniref:Uncharacterized protein n=1 Tax=Pseudovirgaria hyperparasitica TaxID=470096 RepID=A0A6A6WJW6_9PEZI|nr:uncharacterized protein EJ05DRAFT_522542 [Pseudovirgaria hyperparasitica]KAF2762277.1 hypothetical protein EJ05DRAFT_522542 [Pseudovirgaria hyperparasitica]
MSDQAHEPDRTDSVNPRTDLKELQENVLPTSPSTPPAQISIDYPEISPRSISSLGSFIESGIANAITISRVRPSEIQHRDKEHDRRVTETSLSWLHNLDADDMDLLPALPASNSSSPRSSIAKHTPLPDSPGSSTESVWGSPQETSLRRVSLAATTIRHVPGSETENSTVNGGSETSNSATFYARVSPSRYRDSSARTLDTAELEELGCYPDRGYCEAASLQAELQGCRESVSQTTAQSGERSAGFSGSFGDRLKERLDVVRRKSSKALHHLRATRGVPQTEYDRDYDNSHASGSVPSYHDSSNAPWTLPSHRGGHGPHDFQLGSPLHLAPGHGRPMGYVQQYLHDQANTVYQSPDDGFLPEERQLPPPLPPRRRMHAYGSEHYDRLLHQGRYTYVPGYDDFSTLQGRHTYMPGYEDFSTLQGRHTYMPEQYNAPLHQGRHTYMPGYDNSSTRQSRHAHVAEHHALPSHQGSHTYMPEYDSPSTRQSRHAHGLPSHQGRNAYIPEHHALPTHQGRYTRAPEHYNLPTRQPRNTYVPEQYNVASHQGRHTYLPGYSNYSTRQSRHAYVPENHTPTTHEGGHTYVPEHHALPSHHPLPPYQERHSYMPEHYAPTPHQSRNTYLPDHHTLPTHEPGNTSIPAHHAPPPHPPKTPYPPKHHALSPNHQIPQPTQQPKPPQTPAYTAHSKPSFSTAPSSSSSSSSSSTSTGGNTVPAAHHPLPRPGVLTSLHGPLPCLSEDGKAEIALAAWARREGGWFQPVGRGGRGGLPAWVWD